MKQVLITGGATGIGAATAQVFLERGYRVFVTVHQTAAELPGVTAIPCDITDPAAVERLFAAVGTVDVLVNNAGITRDNLLLRMSEEQYDAVIASNQKSVYMLMKLAGSIMLRQKSGRIINMASVAGLYGNMGQCNYSASKGAVIAMTRTAAKELGARGITVNAIAPGFIETPWHSARTQESYDRINRKIALHRFGTVEEVADMAYAVLSNGYMNGSVVDIHGGYDYF